MTDESIVVRFVNLLENSSDLMQNAFSALSEVGAQTVRFTPDECLSVTKKDKRIFYVFDLFSGRFFDHIAATGSRIYGPACILQCLKNGEHLPRLTHPVFSKAMEGLVVSCTNLSSQLRDEVHQRVTWMMGEVSKDFHERVSHLVVGEVGSKKYTVAVSLKKRIMTLEWVSLVWQSCHSKLIRADDPTFDHLQCPPFKGFVICVSGFDSEERTRIKNLVENAGGKYSGEMKINECTHLVVSVAKGQKYEFARKWKINIVSPKWIDDCIGANCCLQERLYAVEKAASKVDDPCRGLTSTPTGESLDVANSSVLSNMSAVSMTTINDTALSRRPSLMPQGQTVDGRSSAGDVTTLPKGQARSSKDTAFELLNSVDLSNARSGFFLDGCKIFICGISSVHLERVRRIINLGGGTRFNQINESVSHVVMGEITDDTVQQLLKASFRPKVVTVRWLIDCYRSGQHLPEDDYRCVDLPELTLTVSPSEKRIREKYSGKNNNEVQSSLPPVKSKVDDVNTTLTSKDHGDDMQDVLSQYMPSMTSGFSLGESTLIRAADAGEVSASKGRMSETKKPDDETMYVPPPIACDDEDETDADEDETKDGLIFANLKFLLFGFDSEEVEMLTSLISENGGCVLPQTTRSVPDYGVVPLFGCPVKATVGEVATSAWLQMSIESGCLLAVDKSIIFSPLSLVTNARPLQDCILSISGYSGLERDVLLEVSQALGGTCQEYFLRKAKGNLLASTHLIVQTAEGSKYVAAKKWNIPAINKMWLFECARTGKRVDVKDFLIDNHPDEPCIRNEPAEVQSIVSASSKRRSQCPSIVPAKRARSQVHSEHSAEENVPRTEIQKESVAVNRDSSNGVFKEPNLPSVVSTARVAASDPIRSDDRSVPRSAESCSSGSDVASVLPSRRESRLNRNRKSSVADGTCVVAVGMSAKSSGSFADSAASARSEKRADDDGSLSAQKRSFTDASCSESNAIPPVDSDRPKIPRIVGKQSNNPKTSSDSSFSALDEFLSARPGCKSNSDVQKPSSAPEKPLAKENSVRDSVAAATFKNNGCGKTPKNGRLEELIQEKKHETPSPPPAGANSFDTPAAGDHYHMKLDLAGVLSPWASPMEVARRPSRVSLPLEELFAESIGIAIQNCQSRSKGDDSFSQRTNTSFCVDMEATSGPLKGVIIAVAKKLSKNQTEYNTAAASLGAEYRWTYDSGCTHFIFQGRLNDTNKEFRLARDHGKFVVSPHWLSACEEQCSRLDEANYPHTFNPSLSLSITGHKTPGKKVSGLKTPSHKTPARPTRSSARPNVDSTHTTAPSVARNCVSSAANGNAVVDFVAGGDLAGVAQPVIAADNGGATSGRETTNVARDLEDADVAAALEEKMEEEVFEAADATLSDEELANVGENLENQDRSTARELTLLNGLKRLNEASRNHGRAKPLMRYLSSDKDALNASVSKLNRSVTENSSKEEIEETKPATTTAKSTAVPKPLLPPKTLAELNTQPSQFVEVVWDDPGAREHREMLASDLEKNSESPGHDLERAASSAVRSEAENDVTVISYAELLNSAKPASISSLTETKGPTKLSTSDNPKKPSPPVPSGALKSSDERSDRKVEKKDACDRPSSSEIEATASKRIETRSKLVFIFSGLAADDRENFSRIVEKLGGSASDTANYTNDCTHLVIEKPTRNEKFLACVASGKWVLHKSYFGACVSADAFVSEEPYEWGSKETAAIWSSLPQPIVRLAESAVRWRRKLSKSGKRVGRSLGAFESWRVLLLTESRREDGFHRLLEAGGATVLSNKLPLNYSTATHAFIDLSKLKFQVDLEGMVRARVSCFKPEYIASYLTDDPLPEPSQFFIPEVNKFLK